MSLHPRYIAETTVDSRYILHQWRPPTVAAVRVGEVVGEGLD